MEESQITPEVIKLSKQIVEHWRIEIYGGCWLTKDSKSALKTLALVTGTDKWRIYFYELNWGNTSNHKNKMDEWFPIPSISDCLEKLRERSEFMPDYYNKKHFDRSLLNIFKNYIKGEFTVEKVHYWLLSALLEVLKSAGK